jgi:hypothetical protein
MRYTIAAGPLVAPAGLNVHMDGHLRKTPACMSDIDTLETDDSRTHSRQQLRGRDRACSDNRSAQQARGAEPPPAWWLSGRP